MLRRYITNDTIVLNLSVKNKEELFDALTKKALKNNYISDEEKFKQGLIEREKQGSTELKPGIAVPHVKSDAVSKIFVILAVTKDKIKFTPGLNKGADVFFLIGAPKMEQKYINVLGAIARLMEKDEVMDKFRKANVKDDIIYEIKKQSLSEKSLDTGKTKYLINLSLNVNYPVKKILTMFLELGINQPVLFEGENLSAKNQFGLSFFGFSAVDVKSKMVQNKTIQGITEDKQAVLKLNELLKADNIDLNSPGTGHLYSVELHNSFGGIDPDLEF